ncbi:metallophosphoesterase [Mesobacillus foraminis]|uniref:metallophosphoesterase n=1 Tax=Mesobacillus foraminis TaxID=279826 RepID=UPI0039A0215B
MGTFLIIAAVFLIIFGLLGLHMYREAHADRTNLHDFSFPELPSSFGTVKIFFISDLHRRIISETVLHNVKGKADLVVIGGDLAEKGVKRSHMEENLSRLQSIGPVYFVWGNNDYEVSSELDELLDEKGVNVLKNSAVKIKSKAGDEFALLGVDDFMTGECNLDEALQSVGDIAFKILISHNPDAVYSITAEQQIQLVLSGHTHGGQIRLFGYGPYELGGIRHKENTTLFVSNGYGTTALPFRLGAPAETHLITLTSTSIGRD